MLVTHFYPPEVGAPQRRLRAFVKHWRAAGIDVDVMTGLPHYPAGRMPPNLRVRDLIGTRTGEFGERVTRVPYLPKRAPEGGAKMVDHSIVAAASLYPALTRPRPDVVLSTVLSLPSIGVGSLAARRWSCPHIIEMRDAWPDLLFKSGLRAGKATQALASVVTRAQRSADAVVTVTSGFREELIDRGFDPARVHHISNGIDVEDVPELPVPAIDSDRSLRVLYLGTHGVSQGLESVVQALASVSAPVEARFIGDGADKIRLMELSSALGAPVSFEDQVQGDQLWAAYEWADTCVVPLQPWEAFEHTVPSKLYELMAAGRHITAALSGEAAEIVRAANAGAVVAPGDHQQLAATLGSLARDRRSLNVGSGPRSWAAENASYPVLASTYTKLFEDLA